MIQGNKQPDVYIPKMYNKYVEKADDYDELMNCFNEKISAHILRTLNPQIRNKSNLSGDIRIICIFQIDTDSKIKIIKVKAPNPSLENELEETIKEMPDIYKPAYRNGVPVKASFSIPVVFKMDYTTPTEPYKSSSKTF